MGKQAWARQALVWGSGLLLSLTASASDPSASRALILPQCTVVLLAGLPGDLETETRYRGEVQSWIEILAGRHLAKQLIVLCDSPEGITLPPGLPGRVLRADRNNFMELGSILATTTDSTPEAAEPNASPAPIARKKALNLLMVIWGHGGRQGREPVFHVRGPRLTPTDFKSLPTRFQGADSNWILLFRGSGLFASELAGPARRILSSEREMMFDSDPIGMLLLLKLVRANPELSFAELGHRLGSATADWYRERNLARTEEPTFWEGTADPQLLIVEGTEASTGSAAQSERTNAPSSQPDSTNSISSELPLSWKGIVRIAPQKYPDVDAVILQRKISYTFGDNPAVASEREDFIQVLTTEGKACGDFDISYWPPDEEINFLDCEVLGPEGKLLRLDPDAIREARQESVGDYQVGRRKIFSLPGIVPGSVLHVRYQTQWKEFPLPHISLALPFVEDLPVADATLKVNVPKGTPFHFAFDQISAPDPQINQGAYGTTYRWHFVELPAHIPEPLSPPQQTPRFLLSTFPDWSDFAQWYGRITKLADEVTPAIAEKARVLTRGANTEQEKVVAIYNYVSGLRYVAIPLGINSFRPHSANNVLESQFGDCKDKANLVNALLHSLGIEAHLVLVPRFSQAYESLPGLAFNHAISQVNLGADTFWVDTTDEVCRFGMLPPGDPGRNVLVIDGKSSTLAQLPWAEPRDHSLRLHTELSCATGTDGVPVTFDALARGFPDYLMRTTARRAEHQGALPLIGAKFRPVAGVIALEKQKSTRASDLDENFSWQAEGTWVGLLTRSHLARSNSAPAREQTLVHAPFWMPKEWDLALHHRNNPLFLNDGYPLTLDEDSELELPSGAEPGPLPAVAGNGAPPLRWKLEWTRLGHDKLAARLHAELAKGELSPADSRMFQQQLRGLFAALGEDAFVSVPQ